MAEDNHSLTITLVGTGVAFMVGLAVVLWPGEDTLETKATEMFSHGDQAVQAFKENDFGQYRLHLAAAEKAAREIRMGSELPPVSEGALKYGRCYAGALTDYVTDIEDYLEPFAALFHTEGNGLDVSQTRKIAEEIYRNQLKFGGHLYGLETSSVLGQQEDKSFEDCLSYRDAFSSFSITRKELATYYVANESTLTERAGETLGVDVLTLGEARATQRVETQSLLYSRPWESLSQSEQSYFHGGSADVAACMKETLRGQAASSGVSKKEIAELCRQGLHQ